MKLRFETESGSLYEIDYEQKTWKRLRHDEEKSPFVRTTIGDITGPLPDVQLGKSVTIVGTSLTPGGICRMIVTSPVTKHYTEEQFTDGK